MPPAQRRQQLLFQAADGHRIAPQATPRRSWRYPCAQESRQHRHNRGHHSQTSDGPSLGVAPSGTCTWMSILSKLGGFTPIWGEIERT